jgi:hypothetical protein
MYLSVNLSIFLSIDPSICLSSWLKPLERELAGVLIVIDTDEEGAKSLN